MNIFWYNILYNISRTIVGYIYSSLTLNKTGYGTIILYYYGSVILVIRLVTEPQLTSICKILFQTRSIVDRILNLVKSWNIGTTKYNLLTINNHSFYRNFSRSPNAIFHLYFVCQGFINIFKNNICMIWPDDKEVK